jgi:hypothetical protein
MPRKGEVTSSYVHILYIIAFALTQFQFNNITTSAVEGNSIFLSAALFFYQKDDFNTSHPKCFREDFLSLIV